MRIKKLSPFVASQIAAGEVIERPASVLKELLENSIDAGSDIIDIELEQGGVRLIRVHDNGCGIYKEDLELALMQHATSKISTVEDLEGISSLGFRGEALASIAAVSQLELISKPNEQEMGWEFKIDNNIVQPAAHHDGTTISVKNLFYNIPARRKFLRSERTEFNYLEELFKRIALSQFDIAFSLTNDDKKIKQLPVCHNELAKAKRLAILCGNRMLEQSIYIDAEQNGLRLSGWLGIPAGARRHIINQFFYINNRMIKDKLINHALKQAYQPYCDAGKYPTYCLYLALDIKALDVNVHPTKHEVRFRDARVVHAFLTKVIQEALSGKGSQLPVSSSGDPQSSLRAALAVKQSKHVAYESVIPAETRNQDLDSRLRWNDNDYGNDRVTRNDNQGEQVKILCIIGGNKLVLAEQQGQIILIDVKATKDKLLINDFEQIFFNNKCISQQPLLMPQAVTFPNNKNIINIVKYSALFEELGFGIDQLGITELLIRAVPLPVCKIELDYQLVFENLAKLFKELKITVLTNIAFAKCIKLLISYVHYPETLTNKEAVQLVTAITALSSTANKGEKPTFKQYSLDEFQEFVYRY